VVSARLDPRIFLIAGDLGYGVIEPFVEEFPGRFANAGVAEQNMTGVAAGLAQRDRIVFTYSIANFQTFRALEQIRNDILYHNLAVTVVSVGSGYGYGVLGYSHHAVEDLGVMRSLPGMRILSPTSDEDVVTCVEEIVKNPGPTYLRLSKDTVAGQVLQRSGFNDMASLILGGSGDIAVLTTGEVSWAVVSAIKNMEDDQRARFNVYAVVQIKPLALDNLDLDSFSLIITVEEHSLESGFGSMVLELLASGQDVHKVRRIGIKSGPPKVVGGSPFLRQLAGLDSSGIGAQLLDFARRRD
jgi:transketolase